MSERNLYKLSATPMGLASGAALNEMSVVIAALNLAVAVAEEAYMVSAAEGALAPSWVDVPRGTTPTAGARMCRGAALHVTESVPAAPHPRVSVAESANTVRRAERPPPGVESCCLQTCLIVPICLCRQRVCILAWTGLLREGAHLVVAGRLVSEGICRRVFGRG